MTGLWLADTNVLVYRHDPSFPEKQARAIALLREGLVSRQVRVPYQAIVEFVAATTRRRTTGPPLLLVADALREAEELVTLLPIVWPVEDQLRLAMRGMAAYQLSWFDALIWATAEHQGIETLYSEDFQHGRLYGRVRAVDPFR